MDEKSETVDRLRIGNLQIVQAEKGYRFSLDPILLSHFAAQGAADQVVDLGTGSGVIPLLLAHLTQASRLIGVELQPAQVARAKRSVELNGLQGRVEIIPGDVRLIRQLLPVGQADLVVANPPFRKPGSGRVAPEDERAAARHELSGGLREFVAAASWLLANRGRFVIIYLAERLPELLTLMAEQKLEPKRLRMIHPHQQEPARLVLVEGRKNSSAGVLVEAPLYIYKGSGGGREYTDDVLEMYADRTGDA
ncbi:MAG TPA: tRNA1(Val) (adenine(37)-N6)-methyltransferase [Malonomonas sp.]